MWKKINIVENNIEAITNKAYLIKMPNNSNYKGYKFWHTDKLIKKDGKIYKLIYNDDFVFKLIKYGAGKYNFKDIVKEVHINSLELEAQFEQIIESLKSTKDDSYLIVKEPKKVDKKVTIKDEFINK
jgi:hypothetical protein